MTHEARQDCSENQKEWKKICTIATTHLGDKVYENFLIHCRFEQVVGNKAILKAPTRLIKSVLESSYKKKLENLWHEINENVQVIDIQVGKKIDKSQQAEKKVAQIIQLPLWAEAVRGTPNAALRGALFAAIAPRNRRALEREIITDEKNLKIIFTGWQLDQVDRDVWEQALHMARQQPLGTDISFTANGFLKALGRSTGKAQYEWLKVSLARLGACFVEITHQNYTYGGSLIEFERDEETQRYTLTVNPKIMKLYTAGWTQNDFEERKKIGNKKFLALWLQGYISSHVELYPMKIKTFLRLSGSSNLCMRDFKRKLLKALEHLKEIDCVKSYNIDNKNLVHIQKCLSDSQKRNLIKNKTE